MKLGNQFDLQLRPLTNLAGDEMTGAKQSTGSRNTANTGNDSGSNVKEAKGPSYVEHHGKHPPNELYKGPKDMHPPKQVPQRNSDKG